jgi:hypothetical protein
MRNMDSFLLHTHPVGLEPTTFEGIISLCTKLCPSEEIPILVNFGATVDTHPSLNFVILK